MCVTSLNQSKLGYSETIWRQLYWTINKSKEKDQICRFQKVDR